MPAKVRIELYRWAGAFGPFKISGECVECDFAVAAIREVMSAHPDWPVEFEVKPWLGNAWKVLRHGGWHAPILLVNGKLIEQGKNPSVHQVEEALLQAMKPVAQKPSGFWLGLFKHLPPPPS
jgi:hypothetical protein